MRSERIGGRRTGRIEVMHGDPPDRIHKMLSIPFRRTLDTRAVRSPQLLQNGKSHQLGPFIALASQSDPKLKITSRRYRLPSPSVYSLEHQSGRLVPRSLALFRGDSHLRILWPTESDGQKPRRSI